VNTYLLSSLLVQGLIAGSTYALLGVAFQIVYSTTRIFHLAQSLVYTGAAYGATITVARLHSPLWLGFMVGLVTGIAVGIIVELGVYRTLRLRKASLLVLFLASLGVSTAGAFLVQIIMGPYQQVFEGFPIVTWYLGTAPITALQVTSMAAGWVCIAAVWLFLRKSKYGFAVLGVSENPNMAGAVGINQARVNLLVMVIGSALASVAAIFFTMGAAANPQMGITPTFIGFVAVFFGGISSLLGSALGGFILGMVASLSGLFVSTDYANVVMFGFLFLLLFFRPQGLLGQRAR
jgi:branched-chain amino acid transport system permease protein